MTTSWTTPGPWAPRPTLMGPDGPSNWVLERLSRTEPGGIEALREGRRPRAFSSAIAAQQEADRLNALVEGERCAP